VSDDSGVREAIERGLRSPLSEGEWAYLVEAHDVAEVACYLTGDSWVVEDPIPEIVAKVKKLREVYESPGPRRRLYLSERQRSEPGDPLETISALAAIKAGKEPGLAEFRSAQLEGRLLSFAEIQPFIYEAARKDGAPTMYLSIPWPEGTALVYDERTMSMTVSPPIVVEDLQARGFVGTRYDYLEYPIDDSGGKDICRVSRGGILDTLRRLADQLAEGLGWRPIEAVAFVLTGFVPSLPPVTATLDHKCYLPAASGLDLRVNLLATVDDVNELILWMRQQLLGRQPRRSTRKHLALAVFAFEHRAKGETWAEIMVAWNAQEAHKHLNGTYEEQRLFRRDATKTLKGLLELQVDRFALNDLA